MNLYSYNPEIFPNFLGDQQNNDPSTFCNQFADFSGLQQQQPLDDCHIVPYHLIHPFDHVVDLTEVPDIPDTCFNYITTLLRENDSDDRPGVTLHDYMTAQVSYNKSLDAALLGELPSISANHCLDDNLNMFSCNNNNNNDNNINVRCANVANVANDSIIYQNTLVGNGSISNNDNNDDVGYTVVNSQFNGLVGHDGRCVVPAAVINGGENNLLQYIEQEAPFGFLSNESWNLDRSIISNVPNSGLNSQIQRIESLPVVQGNMNIYSNTLLQNPILHQIGILPPNFIGCNDTSDKTRGRKHNEGNSEVENQGDDNDERSGKHSAPSNDWCEQIEKYGDVLLCPEGRGKPAALCGKSKSQNSDDQKDKKGGNASKVSKKRGSKGQVADLRALLTRCAQCVARVDLASAYEMLKQIRQHSSPYGDFLQRVAHYLANGLEARLEGKGSELTRANEHISPCEVLKANRVFVGSVPFKIMSYYTTNKTIASLAMESPSIHIIDFGIYYGLQWPCIIQNLSKRPNGPPKIRITGIDFPLRGFRPSERVEETGRCLAKYCEKYNVPFEYNAIAQQWETVKLEDLKIVPNEPLVVNCLYRSHNLFDESVDESSPRDAFLRLVRKINPDIFMHGVVNSTSSVPFFLNRFKEVMFHYSALFDVFEATMSREDNERMLLESKLYGNQALNVIACEGIERVERPETYKQWLVRTQRAGFEQIPLDRDLVRRARAMVKRSFREEFSYDEDGHWVVQGWKGRILYAISCWKPA